MLVLSLFPGVGLLDRAFEEEGFCVVRGPDLLWGGDVRKFHPPRGKFDGVIGGPPCQPYSKMGRLNSTAVDLVPEFSRIVSEAGPGWFLMENVIGVGFLEIGEYFVDRFVINERDCGGIQNRERQIQFGSDFDTVSKFWCKTVKPPEERVPCFLASGTKWNPDAASTRPGRPKGRPERSLSKATFEEGKRAMGLPEDFDLPGFTVAEKIRAIGNGVPLKMGRTLARAVKRAIED